MGPTDWRTGTFWQVTLRVKDEKQISSASRPEPFAVRREFPVSEPVRRRHGFVPTLDFLQPCELLLADVLGQSRPSGAGFQVSKQLET